MFNIDGWYYLDYIQEYLKRNLRQNPNFRYVLFNDQDGRFRGFMHAADFVSLVWLHEDEEKGLHEDEENGDRDVAAQDVVDAIASGDILNADKVIKTRIQEGSSLGEAIRKMEMVEENSLAVVDEFEHFVGVLTREGVTGQLLAQLVDDREA